MIFSYSEVKAIQLSQKSSVAPPPQSHPPPPHLNYSKCSTDLRQHLDSSLRLALDLAVERGASTWLTALPLDEYGFALHKSAFQDALALRYGWLQLRAPTHCACRYMLFRGTELNQRGIFRKMLKRGTIVSTIGIDIVTDLWKALGAIAPCFL